MLARLREPGGDGAALLDQLEVWIEMVATREDAVRIIAELPESCGLDVETAAKARVPGRLGPGWPSPKRASAPSTSSNKDKTALDPHKARVRLIQVYSPEHEAVFLFDLDKLPVEVLGDLGLWAGRRFIAHNAAFEAMMLRARPAIELIDSMQLAGLLLGCESGSRTLANMAQQVLGIEVAEGAAGQRLGCRATCRSPRSTTRGRRRDPAPGGAGDVAPARHG